jgi:uncharacterized membrane protein
MNLKVRRPNLEEEISPGRVVNVRSLDGWKHRLRVFENRVLRRIFGPKRDEATISWRKVHNEELHNLYSWRSIIRMAKSRRMRWGRRGMRIGYWWESQKEIGQ